MGITPFLAVEKGRSTASKRRKTKILLKMKDDIFIRIMARFPRWEPRHCLLSSKTNSTVPTYADEFVFAKYTYLFRSLFLRVEVPRHAEKE